MTTQIPLPNKDLSDINNLKDLKNEISRVKAIVQLQELELKERAKSFPEEAVFASINGFIHIISKRGVPGNILNLVRNGIGLFVNLKKQKKGMQGIVSQAKELVIYSVLTRLVKLYQQNRQQKQKSTPSAS
jgi:hypothetical protein